MNTRRISTYQQCSENDNRGADDLVQLNDIVNDDLADDLAILSLPDHIYKNPIKRGSVKYPSTLRDLSTNDMNVIYNQTQRSTRNVSKSKPLQYNEKMSSMKYHSWTSYDSLKFAQGMDKFYDTVVTKKKSLSTNSTEFKKILDILEIKMYQALEQVNKAGGEFNFMFRDFIGHLSQLIDSVSTYNWIIPFLSPFLKLGTHTEANSTQAFSEICSLIQRITTLQSQDHQLSQSLLTVIWYSLLEIVTIGGLHSEIAFQTMSFILSNGQITMDVIYKIIIMKRINQGFFQDAMIILRIMRIRFFYVIVDRLIGEIKKYQYHEAVVKRNSMMLHDCMVELNASLSVETKPQVIEEIKSCLNLCKSFHRNAAPINAAPINRAMQSKRTISQNYNRSRNKMFIYKSPLPYWYHHPHDKYQKLVNAKRSRNTNYRRDRRPRVDIQDPHSSRFSIGSRNFNEYTDRFQQKYRTTKTQLRTLPSRLYETGILANRYREGRDQLFDRIRSNDDKSIASVSSAAKFYARYYDQLRQNAQKFYNNHVVYRKN